MTNQEVKTKSPRGTFVGTTQINGIANGNKIYNVHISKGQFIISFNNKFIQYVKESVLRKTGIFMDNQIYGRLGYIGCPKR